MEDGFPVFSKKVLNALKNLINSNTELILTSSHRMRFTLPEWKSILRNRDIDINNLSRLDANVQSMQRKDELLEWFNKHPVTGEFVIIDDDTSLHALPPSLKENWIKTNPLVGLNDELVAERRQIKK